MDDQSGSFAPPATLVRGVGDAYAVLIVWWVRKLFYPLLWLGVIVAVLTIGDGTVDLNLDTPHDAWDDLASPYAGVIIALAIRVGANLAALGVAYPAAKHFETSLERRHGFASWIGVWGDRLNAARAYRAMRWTHGARQIALRRLGPRGPRLARIDRAIDVLNGLMAIMVIVALLMVGS